MACPSTVTQLGLVRDTLGAIDCQVQTYSVAGYQALTGPGSPWPAALTAMLVIYVAVIGYRLMFAMGNQKLSDAPMVALEVGGILALTLNWGAFQTVVFDVAANAPLEIARVISRPMALDRPAAAADPVTALQATYDELTADQIEFGKKAGPNALASRGGDAAAADELWKAGTSLLASTSGVLAVSSIATGVLTALGPVFIALFLFEATRGFFVGWVRALVAAMAAPLLCWITTSLLLVVIQPWIEELSRQRQAHALNVDTAASAASIVMIFAAAQAVLILAGLIVAGGFNLRKAEARSETGLAAAGPAGAAGETRSVRVSGGVGGRAGARTTSFVDAGGGGAALAASPGTAAADDRFTAPSTRAVRLGETYGRARLTRDRARISAAERA